MMWEKETEGKGKRVTAASVQGMAVGVPFPHWDMARWEEKSGQV